jgi:hypothetical protein
VGLSTVLGAARAKGRFAIRIADAAGSETALTLCAIFRYFSHSVATGGDERDEGSRAEP